MNKNQNKGFSKIDKIITNTAKQYNLENVLYKHKTMKYWHEVAATFVDKAEDLTKAVDFQKGVLIVACLSKEVASKLKLLTVRIIEALNQLVGRRVVFAIHVEF